MNGQYAHNIDAKGRLFIPTKLRDELGGSPDNFYRPEIDRAAVLARLEEDMAVSAAPVLKNFRAGPTSTPASRARALPGSRVCA